MIDLNEVYLSGKTQRYHARPEMAVYNQTTADHSWGVATLMVLLKPDVSREALLTAIFHDSGERWAGDLPYPFKRSNAYLAQRHAVTEARLARENGVPQYVISEEEHSLMKLCDRLEAHLFVKLRQPHILETGAWVKQAEGILKEAVELGVEEKVKELLNA